MFSTIRDWFYMFVFMFAGMFIIPQVCIRFLGHIPFVMVLFFAICGGYVGALTFSIIQRADIFLPSGLFNNDYKKIIPTLGILKYSYELNEHSSFWQIFFQEYLRYGANGFLYFPYIFKKITIEVYDNLTILKRQNECLVINDFDNVRDVLYCNNILTFRYCLSNNPFELAFVDIKICGGFAEKLYDYLIIKFGEDIKKHLLYNQ